MRTPSPNGGKNVGVVFQFFQLLPTLTVLENVMMPMYYVGSWQDSVASARWSCWNWSTCPISRTSIRQISGGQQRAPSPARGERPPVIVGDEPTGNLDMVSAVSFRAV